MVRKADYNDFEAIMDIYRHAQSFMQKNGNPDQWGNFYPPAHLIKKDISTKMYVCTENGEILCVFYYAQESDPDYSTIENGAWLCDKPYGVVHRVASSHKVKGAAKFSLNWAYEQCKNLRIDTHEDNTPMQSLLKSLGFSYCGIIRLSDGEKRLAFQKSAQ